MRPWMMATDTLVLSTDVFWVRRELRDDSFVKNMSIDITYKYSHIAFNNEKKVCTCRTPVTSGAFSVHNKLFYVFCAYQTRIVEGRERPEVTQLRLLAAEEVGNHFLAYSLVPPLQHVRDVDFFPHEMELLVQTLLRDVLLQRKETLVCFLFRSKADG